MARSFHGLQVGGAFTYAQCAEGVQLGLVNVTGALRGVQLGLINVARRGGLELAPGLDIGNGACAWRL